MNENSLLNECLDGFVGKLQHCVGDISSVSIDGVETVFTPELLRRRAQDLETLAAKLKDVAQKLADHQNRDRGELVGPA